MNCSTFFFSQLIYLITDSSKTISCTGLGAPGDLYIFASAIDIYGSSAKALAIANVKSNPSFNSSKYLENSLRKHIPSGDIDAIFQTINLVSSAVSVVNCTASPNCAALFRYQCLDTVNTCYLCQQGYKGVVGSDNSLCIPEAKTSGAIGRPCTKASDCLYGLCANGVCAAPKKACQSQSPNTICSGHGNCFSYDTSQNIVANCTILDPLCSAKCKCDPGYGAADCSLNPLESADRSSARSSMCGALLHVISVSDRSPQLFDSIASALLSAFEDTEIFTAAGKVQCSSVLRFLGTLATKGFLKGALAKTAGVYSEASSQFVGSGVTDYFLPTAGSRPNEATRFANDITDAVVGMTQGTMKTMVVGQAPVSLVTGNVRLTVKNDLVSLLLNAELSPPRTTSESVYGSVQPKIKVVGNGLSYCSGKSAYAQVSTLQYGTNPHAGSTALQTSMLQFTSTITTQVPKKTTKTKKAPFASSEIVADVIALAPAYYIILQYATTRNFNLSIQAKPYDKHLNVTLPECTLYDYDKAKYVSCSNCNISSYTNHNATFGCYNIRNLCPAIGSKRRLTSSGDNDEDNGDDDGDIEDNVDNYDKKIKDNKFDEDFADYYHSRASQLIFEERKGSYSTGRRNLIGDDEYQPSADDGPASADDQFTSKNQATGSEFGSVLNAIGAELGSILSQNPFAIDLSKATPILSFVGSLAGFLLIGLVFFLRWDKDDRHKIVYLYEEKLRVSRLKIQDDLTKGGNGIHFAKERRKEFESTQRAIKSMNKSFFNLSRGTLNSPSEQYPQHCSQVSFLSDDIISEEESTDPLDHPLATTVLVADFTHKVLPTMYTLNKGELHYERGRYKIKSNTTADTLRTLLKTHYLSAMWYGSSMRISRTLRFLELMRVVLMGLFIDTVIYGVYFPSDATCEKFETKSTCLSLPSKVSHFQIA